jgi:hypothetical protein
MTNESMLIKTSDVVGSALNDLTGTKLGAIREVFFDRRTGQARYAAVELSSLGGLLGGGGKYHPVPWRLLSWSDHDSAYVVDMGKDRLKVAPAYDRDQLNSTAYGWSEQVERYFDTGPAAPAA